MAGYRNSNDTHLGLTGGTFFPITGHSSPRCGHIEICFTSTEGLSKGFGYTEHIATLPNLKRHLVVEEVLSGPNDQVVVLEVLAHRGRSIAYV